MSLGQKEPYSLVALHCVNLQESTKYFDYSPSAPPLHLQINWQNLFTTKLVNASLIIAELDPSQRRQLFNQAMCYLLYESNHASFYIARLVKDEFLNFEALIPFIEHFIKRCTKDVLAKVKKRLDHVKHQKKIHTNFSLENQRKQMVTYQNSLLIMKHFNGLPWKKIYLINPSTYALWTWNETSFKIIFVIMSY